MSGLWCEYEHSLRQRHASNGSKTNFIFHHYCHNKLKHLSPFLWPICRVLKLCETLMYQTSQASGGPRAVWRWVGNWLYFYSSIYFNNSIVLRYILLMSRSYFRFGIDIHGMAQRAKSDEVYFNASEAWGPKWHPSHFHSFMCCVGHY